MDHFPPEVWKEVFMHISESNIPLLPGATVPFLKLPRRRIQGSRRLKSGLKSLLMVCKSWHTFIESYSCFWSAIIYLGWPYNKSQEMAFTHFERQFGNITNCEIVALMDSSFVGADTWYLGIWRKELQLLVRLRSHHIVVLAVPFAASDHQAVRQLSPVAFPRLRLLRIFLPCPPGDDDHCATLIKGNEDLLSNMRRNTGLASSTRFSSIAQMSINVTRSKGPFGAMFQLLAMIPTIKDLCIHSVRGADVRELGRSLENVVSDLPPFLPNIQRLWMRGDTKATWPIYLARLLQKRTLEFIACEFDGRSIPDLTLPIPFLPIPTVSASKVQWTGSDSPLGFNLSVESSIRGWLYPSNTRVTNPELIRLPSVSFMDIGYSPSHYFDKGSVDLSRIVDVAHLSTLTLRLLNYLGGLRGEFGFTSNQPTMLPALTELTAVFRVPQRIFELRSFRMPSLIKFTLKYDEGNPESFLYSQVSEELAREGGGTLEMFSRHVKKSHPALIGWESYLTISKLPLARLVELAIPDGDHLHIILGATPNVAILRIYVRNYRTDLPYCFRERGPHKDSGRMIWWKDPFPLSKLVRLDIIQECLPRIWNYECWSRTAVASTLKEFVISRRSQCPLQVITITRGFLHGKDRELLHSSGVDLVEIEEGKPDAGMDVIHFDRSSDASVWNGLCVGCTDEHAK